MFGNSTMVNGPENNPSSSANMGEIALVGLASLALPFISQKISEFVDNNGVEYLRQRGEQAYHLYVPHVMGFISMAGSAAERTTIKIGRLGLTGLRLGLTGLTEVMDITGQLKNPSISINKSQQRLNAHNLPFGNCVDFLAEETAQAYINHSEQIKHFVCQSVFDIDQMDEIEQLEAGLNLTAIAKMAFLDGASQAVGWFLSLSTELIAQTIKANILHIAANLADEGFDKKHAFADNQRNPFGRLLSVIGNCLIHYEERLNDVALLPENEQEIERQLIFTELSSDLLGKFFPRGEQDLQFFHPIIPCMKIIKNFVWEKMNRGLPLLLERLYLETRPLDLELGWQEQLVDLPSNALQQFIRDNRARSLNVFKPSIEKWLRDKKFIEIDVEQLSTHLIKFAKEFLLTEDPTLHRIGSFFERYLMERILHNLSHFVPEDEVDSIPLYIAKQWMGGDLFHVFNQVISGNVVTIEDKESAVNQFLAPFGLIQKESFPLPPAIKEKAWPAIQDLLKEKIPTAFFKGTPKWLSLEKRIHNQNFFDATLDDPSLKKTISNVAHTLTEKVFQLIQSLSIGNSLNDSLPFLILSSEQRSALDEQSKEFLEDDQSSGLLKNFGNHGIEAALLQVSKNLYNNYQKASNDLGELQAFKGAQLLFGDIDESEETEEDLLTDSLSFYAWFFTEVTKACESLTVEGLGEEEIVALQRAIELKNTIRDAEDQVQADEAQVELDELWIEIQPKFDHVLMHLLKMLGCKTASDLPFPQGVQSSLWKLLTEKMPYFLFQQIGDTLLPLLEKKELQAKIEKLPNGGLDIKQSCTILAQDMVNHLPGWLDSQLKALPEKITAEDSDIDLTLDARNDFINNLQIIVKGEDPAYKPLWKWLESYFEGIFLKIASQVSQMKNGDFDQIYTFVQQAKDQLLTLEQLEKVDPSQLEDHAVAKEQILVHLTDQLFGALKITLGNDVWGIPQFLQKMVLNGLKVKVAQSLLGLYQTEHKIRHHVVKANAIEAHAPTSEIAQAILAMTNFALNRATDELNQTHDGKVKGVSQIYQSLNIWMDQQTEKGYKSAVLFKEMIAQNVPTPPLIKLLEQLDIPSNEIYKQHLAKWLNPVLTDQALYHLTTLLEKEGKGKASFDREILMALVPVLMNHLKHLNQATAVPADKDTKDLFYNNQAHVLFQLVFPNGKADLEQFLPGGELPDDQFVQIQESAQNVISKQLPFAMEALFNKETLLILFTSIFEGAIENLDYPIDLNGPELSDKPVLTAEEMIQQKEMNQQVGELTIEIAKFIDLPIGFLEKMPGWLNNGIKNHAFEAIGEKVREKFDGQLFEKQIPIILSNMEKQKFIKFTPEGKIEFLQETEKNLNELERKFAQKSLDFFIRYWGIRLEKATDIFTHPVMKFFRTTILSISSFVLVNLLGSLLHFLRIDRLFVNSLHAIIHHRTQKIQSVFSQPVSHENLVFQGVEALEAVLMKNDAE